MKIITIANQKGGVGKSTIAINFFNYCIENNIKTVFLDLDPQGNSSKSLINAHPSLEARNNSLELITACTLNNVEDKHSIVFSGNAKLVEAERKPSNLKENLRTLADDYDVCIIDTPPTAGFLQVSPLMLSDYVLSPIELHNWSYDGSLPFLTMLGNLTRLNKTKKPVFLGLIPNRVWVQSPKQRADLKKLMSDEKLSKNLFGGGEYYIPMRHCYIESGATGNPVWSFKDKSSARKEGVNIKNICNALLKSMNVKEGV